MKALAIDLGGSHATCALVEDATILECTTISTRGENRLEFLLPALRDTVLKLIPRDSVPGEIAGLAFCFCGLVDTLNNRILSTNGKYDDGPSLNLAEWSEASFGLSLRMENDARLALLGEWYAGAARNHADVVMITLGTGIGGAAMMNGRMLRGRHFQAGCLGGHFSANFRGYKCSCGAVGCAEAEASTSSLPIICRDTPGFESTQWAQSPSIGFEQIFANAKMGDAFASQVRDRCLKVWGAATVTLIHAYDPELVVFGGGVMKSADAILPFVQSYVNQHAWTPWGKVRICRAELGNEAALLGAVPLFQGIDGP